MPGAGWRGALKFGLPGLALGVFLAGFFGIGQAPPALAQAQRMAEAAGTLAFTSNGPASSQWLYLIDTKTQAFAIYRVDPANPKGMVKLEAARRYVFDLKLAEYNNLPPEVVAIESMTRTTK